MTDPHQSPASAGGRPILAPDNASPALASQPDGVLDGAYNAYQATPAPWWIGALWLAFFAFALVYLISNLLR